MFKRAVVNLTVNVRIILIGMVKNKCKFIKLSILKISKVIVKFLAPAALWATAISSCPPLLRTLQLWLALRSRTF